MTRHIFNDVQIFDGSGSASRPGSVIVDGERIVKVAFGQSSLPTQPEDVVIEGRGRTLMPGLIEAHGHLSWGSSIEKIYHAFMLPPDELRVATWRNARVLLDHGFTSVFSAGALGDRLEVDLREEIDAGETPGPRLRASTLERSPEGAEGVETGDIDHGRGPGAMTAFMDHCAAVGVDNVKLLLSGENALMPGSSHDILYTEEELVAAAAGARKHHLRLLAHAYTPKAIQMGLRNGVTVFYHCSWADKDTLDEMQARRDEIFVAPAIGVIVSTLEADPPPQFDMSAMKKSAEEVLGLARQLMPELKRRGIRVLPGGDYGFPFNPNGRNARDIEHFVNLFGYSPLEALSAATKLGGELMGLEAGQVKEGYLADLLLVDGDPTQDVRVLQDASRLNVIMKGGAPYKADTRANTEELV